MLKKRKRPKCCGKPMYVSIYRSKAYQNRHILAEVWFHCHDCKRVDKTYSYWEYQQLEVPNVTK